VTKFLDSAHPETLRLWNRIFNCDFVEAGPGGFG
jgi:hypothetical protein